MSNVTLELTAQEAQIVAQSILNYAQRRNDPLFQAGNAVLRKLRDAVNPEDPKKEDAP